MFAVHAAIFPLHRKRALIAELVGRAEDVFEVHAAATRRAEVPTAPRVAEVEVAGKNSGAAVERGDRVVVAGDDFTVRGGAAAAWLLMAEPGNYELVRRVLGHKNLETTIRFYVGLESLPALKHYHQTVLASEMGDGPRMAP